MTSNFGLFHGQTMRANLWKHVIFLEFTLYSMLFLHYVLREWGFVASRRVFALWRGADFTCSNHVSKKAPNL